MSESKTAKSGELNAEQRHAWAQVLSQDFDRMMLVLSECDKEFIDNTADQLIDTLNHLKNYK